IGKFVKSAIFDEIIPTLDLPEEELFNFAEDVLDRFRNPFIKHYLMSISLNSMSKFETRVLPSILEYKNRKNELPKKLVFSLASLIYFYKGDRNGEIIKDLTSIVRKGMKEAVREILR
ncbi:MAG TPA: tagaturonate reductase, partial [Bacteroidales bacterium]|nr:tagaturonate reductase [Bacteroidales bacterium]